MPQLDKASYLSQLFWLVVIFCSFYAIIVRFYLPKLARILKIRQKTLKFLRSPATGGTTTQATPTIDEKPLIRVLEEGRVSLTRAVEATNTWYAATEKEIQLTQWAETNETYLTSLGLLYAAQEISNIDWCE